MKISRTQYWLLAATVILFLILLNVVKVQDVVARGFGYSGSVPMFALDEMTRGYTPAEAVQVIDSYGVAGRRAYRFLLLTIDLAFPFLYGSFLFLSIRGVSRRAAIPAGWASGLAAFGYLATLCDWLENACFLILIRDFPRQPTTVVNLASKFTIIKFASSGFSLGVLVVLGIYILLRTALRRPVADA
jgi:hypothetical protein